MTIDMITFEMTLEVLGDGEDASDFFRTYERETRKDLESMRQFMYAQKERVRNLIILTFSDARDWIGLKRVCHTWKGRASQIGFSKSSYIAASLHDFLQNTNSDMKLCSDTNLSDHSGISASPPTSNNEELVLNQVEVFLDTLGRECETINSFLKSQYLL